jgi:O-antigen/teichoic acid export membrane protein
MNNHVPTEPSPPETPIVATKWSDEAAVLTISQLFLYAGSLVVSMILVRMISITDYGTFMQVTLIVTTVVPMVVLGVPASVFYFVPQMGAEEVKRFLTWNAGLLMVFGLAVAAILYAFIHPLANLMSNPPLEQLVGYVALLLVLGILSEIIVPALISMGKARVMARLNILFIAANLVVVPVVLLMGFGLEGVFLGTAALQAAQLAVAAFVVGKLPGSIWPLPAPQKWLEQFKFSLPIGSARIVSGVKPKVDQLFIAHWYAPDMFAIYARGAFRPWVTGLVVNNVSNVVLPRLVALRKENRIQEVFEMWQDAMRQICLVCLPIFVFFFVFAREIFTIMFTEAYLDSVPVFWVYLFVLPVEIFFFGHLHQAFGKPKYILYANLLGLPVSIALAVLFHSLFGFLGPAIAGVMTRVLTVAYHLKIISGYFSASFLRVIPWAHQARIFGLSLVSIVIAYPLKWTGAPVLITTLFSALVFAMAYLWLIDRFGYLSDAAKDAVRRRFIFMLPGLARR